MADRYPLGQGQTEAWKGWSTHWETGSGLLPVDVQFPACRQIFRCDENRNSSSTINMSSSANISASRRLATTFGIELECVLAFHETELEKVLEQYSFDAKIHKTLTRHAHVQLLGGENRHISHERTHFPSWVLEVPMEEATLKASRVRSTVSANALVRAYFSEPLLVTKNALGSACPANIVGDMSQTGARMTHSRGEAEVILEDTQVDYKQWILTYERTVPGSTKRELLAKAAAVVSEENKNEWDSAGIELVSPKFEYSDRATAFVQIGQYTKALRGETSKSHRAYDSKWAGMHVHVGLDVKEGQELKGKTGKHITAVLQHVAYILVCHEDLITQLHPEHRSGAPHVAETLDQRPSSLPQLPDEDEESWAERTAAAATASHTGYPELASNARHLATNVVPSGPTGQHLWKDLRNALFDKDLSLGKLIKRMQGTTERGEFSRAYFVNWANLDNFRYQMSPDKPLKPTVEFRQHEATLDSEEIQHWVNFLFALFRVAEDKEVQATKADGRTPIDETAIYAEQQGSKYSVNHQWHQASIDEFLGDELLNLDETEKEYWKSRFKKYRRNMAPLPWI